MSEQAQRVLPVFPYPLSDAARSALVLAKEGLKLDFLVVPSAAFVMRDGQWFRTTNARTLCIGEQPPGLSDHAVINDISNQRSVTEALRWVLGNHDDNRATLVAQHLNKLIGAKEIPSDQLRYEHLSKNLKLNDGGKVPMFREEGGDD